MVSAKNILKEAFRFKQRYPMSIVFMLVISILFSLNSVLAIMLSSPIAIALVTLVVSVFLSLIELGGYPIIVHDGVKTKKVNLHHAFKMSLNKIVRLFVVTVLVAVVTLSPILVAGMLLFLFFSPAELLTGTAALSTNSLMVLVPVFILAVAAFAYLAVKFWMIYPVVMLENKPAVKSMKESWNISNGKFWPLFSTLLLTLVLIVIPGIVISYAITFTYNAGIFLLWNIIYTTYAGVLYGVVNTITYLHLKKK
ncbi:MAG TPA: glycerophosphoryl diester phosphodiesterase membrane domain-containing protein [archaeon]|nr:glycerophosphoryl diester phosphodiesterase membrane domain-containing protein [archaeon]